MTFICHWPRHYKLASSGPAVENAHGNPGEPIARLAPLNWTRVGAMEGQTQDNIRTNFVRIYFVTNETDNIDIMRLQYIT